MADTSVNMIILGIVLLILVALIVLALTVGNVGKKLASSGIQQVQNGANQFLIHSLTLMTSRKFPVKML